MRIVERGLFEGIGGVVWLMMEVERDMNGKLFEQLPQKAIQSRRNGRMQPQREANY